MLRRQRFWTVYLPLCWLPAIVLRATRFLVEHLMGMQGLWRFGVLSAWTQMSLALALPAGVVVTFLLLVRRRPPVAGGEVECSR